jgi:hypothetical protein
VPLNLSGEFLGYENRMWVLRAYRFQRSLHFLPSSSRVCLLSMMFPPCMECITHMIRVYRTYSISG